MQETQKYSVVSFDAWQACMNMHIFVSLGTMAKYLDKTSITANMLNFYE